MEPERLNARTLQKIVVMIDRYLRECSLPRISSTICTRTKSRTYSIALWNRPGTSEARRAATTNTTSRAIVMTARMIQMRSIWNGVPSKRIADGKKSLIDGVWNPPSPPSAEACTTDIAGVNRRTPGFRRDRNQLPVGTPSDQAIKDSPHSLPDELACSAASDGVRCPSFRGL